MAINYTNRKVFKLSLTLDTKDLYGSELYALRKYGKVKNGISRDILVSADQSLLQLHYIIQKLFGWENGHLHKFELFPKDMEKLVGDSFAKYCYLCGIYFRFYYDDEMGMDDIYWDLDFDEHEMVKSWGKEKYKGIFPYLGLQENYLVAQSEVCKYLADVEDEKGLIEVNPTFGLWRKGMTEPQKLAFEDVPYQAMLLRLDCCLGELCERLSLGEIFTKKRMTDNVLGLIYNNVNDRHATLESDLKKMDGLLKKRIEIEEKTLKLLKYKERKNVNLAKVQRDTDEIDTLTDEFDAEISELFDTTNDISTPIVNKLIYNYDFGDGWEVTVKLVDEYKANKDGKFSEEILNKVYSNAIPVCVDADGLPVMDDVGGVFGYCDLLLKMYDKGAVDEHFPPKEAREWARSMGWTGRMIKPENML